MSSNLKPLLAITMGDPGGIGPEVVVRAWEDPQVHACCVPVALGHPEVLRRAVQYVGSHLEVVTVDSTLHYPQAETDQADPNHLVCLPVGEDSLLDAPVGEVDPRAGEAAYQAVLRATRGALAGEFDGMVTGPLSKAALQAAGHWYPGHTELLAELCGVDDFAMMLYLPPEELTQRGNESGHGLGVVHTTLHCALRDVFEQLTPELIAAKCKLASAVAREGFGIAKPKIGVLALNPHAGEDGLFGDEENRIIKPAVKLAKEMGIDVSGPYPADTLLIRAAEGEFQAVVAMYHDQGHIALKLLGMHRAVNITLGLPIVRTSVAHGTAFDRAWKEPAHKEPARNESTHNESTHNESTHSETTQSSGMVAAIKVASELARRDFHFKTKDEAVIAKQQ